MMWVLLCILCSLNCRWVVIFLSVCIYSFSVFYGFLVFLVDDIQNGKPCNDNIALHWYWWTNPADYLELKQWDAWCRSSVCRLSIFSPISTTGFSWTSRLTLHPVTLSTTVCPSSVMVMSWPSTACCGTTRRGLASTSPVTGQVT